MMNESNTKILYSTEYGMFRFMTGNRDMNEAKINNLVKSVNTGLNIFKYNPIMINEQNFIIDGQHRFMACKKLKLPVYYVVVPEFSLRQIAEMNNNQSKWRAVDFLNCYIDAGVNKTDYSYLLEFLNRYKINISSAIGLLMYGKIGGGGQTDAFKNGNFKVNNKDFANNIVCKAIDYEPFCDECRSRQFLQAIEVLNRSAKYEHAKVLEKFQKHELTIDKQSSHKEYLKCIEERYNYRNSVRQVIY